MERNLYDKTAERLWEKLEWHRDKINTSCVDFKEPFLVDQLTNENPFIMDIIGEVEKEFDYSMSEFQCSWATLQFIKGGLDMMEKYNKKNNTELKPRP